MYLSMRVTQVQCILPMPKVPNEPKEVFTSKTKPFSCVVNTVPPYMSRLTCTPRCVCICKYIKRHKSHIHKLKTKQIQRYRPNNIYSVQ